VGGALLGGRVLPGQFIQFLESHRSSFSQVGG
jgi:hypothetical protein